MKLTIITVCFNDLAGLKKTMTSLESQGRHDFEQIVVDGGSKDGTPEWLADFSPAWKFRFISEKDRGTYDAMNKGVDLAQGEFVWFLNSGDFCADSGSLTMILESLAADEADVLYGKVWVKSPFGLRPSGFPVSNRSFWAGMPICHQALIYKRELLQKFPYSLDYRIISDWVTTRQMFESGARFKFIDQYLSVFNTDGMSSRSQWKVLKEKLRSEETWFRKSRVLLLAGSKTLAIWATKKTGIYSALKKIQHQIHGRPSDKPSEPLLEG